jgi:pantothenate kinase
LPAAARERADALLRAGGRRLLGIAGPPGAGKSTLACALQAALGDVAAVVPMDGFHLAGSELARRGLAHRKGAPETFDADGYLALLQRLRAPVAGRVVHAPEFRRGIGEPIAGAIAVPDGVRLVITEGNYLLLDADPWRDVLTLLDDCWYVDVDDALRVERLVRRHERFGRSPADARAWVAGTDEPNARAVAPARARASWTFRWTAE